MNLSQSRQKNVTQIGFLKCKIPANIAQRCEMLQETKAQQEFAGKLQVVI